jgi:hypothetical protein
MCKKTTILLTLIITIIGINLSTISVHASTLLLPPISSTKYMKCFSISTGNTPAYSDSSLSKQIGVIYGTDEIYVASMNGKWAFVSYPISGGRKSAYIHTSAITFCNFNNVVITSFSKITTYKRPGSSSYGYISIGDLVYTIGSSTNYYQVIYPINKGWKMGWIRKSDYSKL